MKRKKLLLIAGASAALLVVSASILSLIDFNSPEIGRAFMEQVGESTELQWTAERFRLNVLRGLYLENVTATGEIAGKQMEARITNVTVKHRLLPLLRREISAKQIVINDPEVELFPIAQKGHARRETTQKKQEKVHRDSASPSPEPETAEPVRVGISKLHVENGRITVHSPSGRRPETVIKSLSMTMNDLTLNDQRRPIIQRFSANGEVDADEIIIGKTRIENNAGQIRIADGEIHVKDLSFETDEGKFNAELSLNLKTSPFTYDLVLSGDPVNTNLVLGGKERDELGATKLEFRGAGSGTDSSGLRGEGKFTLENGKLPSTPIFESIERVIGNKGIVGAQYKSGTTVFRIQDNRVQLDGFALHIEQGSLDLSGSVSLDGPLRLHCKVRVPRQNVKIKELPKEVIDVITNDAGQVTLPFKIRGNPENPITELDTGELLAQASEGTKRVLKEKISEKLKELFKKKNH